MRWGDVDVGLNSDYCSNKLFDSIISITPPFKANCSTGEKGMGVIARRRLGEKVMEM